MKIKPRVYRTGEYRNGHPVIEGTWDYDDEFKRALEYGKKLVRELNLNQWDDQIRSSWVRMSLPWEKKEDDFILSFMNKFEGTGKRGDIIHCLAWIIDRTTTSISTRLTILKKDKCPCCGKQLIPGPGLQGISFRMLYQVSHSPGAARPQGF